MSSEVEVAVQLAKLSAEVKQMSLWSDIAKVGIPSFVATISAWLTYKISSINASANIQISESNKKFDKEIESLKIDYEKQKEYDNRSYIIAQELANNASIIYHAINSYNYSINGFVNTQINDEIKEHMKKVTIEKYNYSYDIYTETRNKIISASLLIGDKTIKERIKSFNNSANNIFAECSPTTKLNLDSLHEIQNKYEEATELLFSELSIYLNIRQK